MADPCQWDIGTELVVAFKDEDGNVVNISSASEKTIYLTRPDSTVLTFTGASVIFDTDGTDGLAKYLTVAGDFNRGGNYEIHGFAKIGTKEFSTEPETFHVHPSRRPAPV